MLKVLRPITLLCLIVLTACGDSGSNGKNEPNSDQIRGIDSLTANETLKYRTNCIAEEFEDENGDVESTSYSTRDLKIKGIGRSGKEVEIVSSFTSFLDAKCKKPVAKYRILASGEMFDGNTRIVTTFNNFYITPLIDMAADYLNNEAECERTNWVTKVEQEVTECYLLDSIQVEEYINSRDNGRTIDIYSCEEDQPIEECDKMTYKKY